MTGPRYSSRRWIVVASIFLLAFITIMDRVAVSAGKAALAAQLHLSDLQFGWVFGAFTMGYAIFMVPSGWLADRFKPRRFLAAALCLWSLFTMATGMASTLGPLIAVRLLFGCAEAGAYPAASRALYSWTAPGERGLALGLMNTGSRLGAALGLTVASYGILWLGWRRCFLLLGALGIGWALWWLLWYRDDPSLHPAVSEAELALIRGGRETATKEASAGGWASIVFSRQGGLLLFQYFANNFTLFVVYSWMLPYLQDHYHLSPARVGIYAGLPMYFGAAATWAGGGAVDALFGRGYRGVSRALPGVVGFSIAAVSVALAAYAKGADAFVVLLGLAVFGLDFTIGASWTVCTDIGRERTGTVSAAMNMMGAAGSFTCSLAFPYFLQLTGGAGLFLILAAGLNVLAAGCWLGLGARPRLARAGAPVRE
jgi:ACS family glucarate transporter-like MFS transporter